MNIDEIKEKFSRCVSEDLLFWDDTVSWFISEHYRLTKELTDMKLMRDRAREDATRHAQTADRLAADLAAAREEAIAGERRGMERAAGLLEKMDDAIGGQERYKDAATIRAEAAKLPQSEVIPCNFPDCDTARALRVGFDAARREGMLEGLRRACEVAEDVPTTVSVHATAHDASVATRYKEAIVLAITADIGATVRAAIRAESQGRKGGP